MPARVGPPQRKSFRILVTAALAGVAACCAIGCVSIGPIPAVSGLPDRHDVRLDQLIVHSNSELPGQHRLLRELNDQRADLSNKLALPISDEPIDVYLFTDAERFAEFIQRRFPEFPTRRAFFVETDTRLTVYAHWGDRVAEDLRHEVSHGYLHSVVQNLPLWLDEGLAEYFELPRGSRGLNRPHVDELVSLARQGRWSPNLRRLEAITTPAEMSQREYAEAWLWVHLLLETEPARRQLLQTYLADLRRDPSVPPLSFYLRRLAGSPDAMLIAHLHSLEETR
jgi:hypothetical protein